MKRPDVKGLLARLYDAWLVLDFVLDIAWKLAAAVFFSLVAWIAFKLLIGRAVLVPW